MNLSMVDIEYNESYDNPQSIWKPHEKAIMSVLSVLPVTSSVFCQSDYFACPDFCQRYCDVMVRDMKKSLYEDSTFCLSCNNPENPQKS